jgi:membrane protein
MKTTCSGVPRNWPTAIFSQFFRCFSLFLLCSGYSPNARHNWRSDLLFYHSQILPPAALDLLAKTIDEVTRNTGGAKITFGIVFALISASGGMTSMISALNGVYGVRDSRLWWKVRLIALGLTIAISVLVVCALALVLVGGHAAELVGAKFHLGPLLEIAWKVLQWPAALFLITLSFSLIYFFAPDIEEQHWYWITPGSIVGVLLWLAVSFGFRAYLHFFNSYSKTYGSLGAAIILLIWFYVTGLAFLIGGEINAQIEHAAARRGHPEAKAPGGKTPQEGTRAAA